MTKPLGRTAWLVCAALSAACGLPRDTIDVDLEAPYVRSVSPGGNAVRLDARLEIRFSKPVREDRIYWIDKDTGREFPDGVALVLPKDEKDAGTLVSAMNTMPLTTSQRAKLIPCHVELSADRTTVTMRPIAPLEPQRTYLVLASKKITDDRNNKISASPDEKRNETVVVRFTTAPAEDREAPVATLGAPAAGSTGVSIELPAVEVRFSKDLDRQTLTADRIGLIERLAEAGADDPGTRVAATKVVLEGRTAVATLPQRSGQDCDRLCLGRRYELFVSPDVRDLSGNGAAQDGLALQFFQAADCIDESAPRIGPAAAVPSDDHVVIAWKTDEASTSEVHLAAGDAADLVAACDASPRTAGCRVVKGAGAVCYADICDLPEDAESFQCGHSVRVEGLSPGTAYAYRVLSADAGGRTTAGEAESFTTLEPLPKVVLNELLAAPVGFGAPRSVDEAKFVELQNVGLVEVDLAGWKLGRCVEPACTSPLTNLWTLKVAATGASTLLAPGAYAVAGGDKFDADVMGVPAGALLLRGSSSTLLGGGLTSTVAYAYALVSPAGAVVSTYGAHLGLPNRDTKDVKNLGHSFERKAASGADTAGNWTTSSAAIGSAPAGNFATPGAKNSAAP